MSNFIEAIRSTAEQDATSDQQLVAEQRLRSVIDYDSYVGDVYSIGYDRANVQIHDYYREQVGGIPALSVLVATRVGAEGRVDIKAERASAILLRVLDQEDLPDAGEALRVRVESARHVAGTSAHWDSDEAMDAHTNQHFGYAGVRCRVIGTFWVEDVDGTPQLLFGADISNYYPNRGLKVYRPSGAVLSQIVNYRDPRREGFDADGVRIGTVRYASTHRRHQQIDDVAVSVNPADLLSQKTALFGMTRTGKSNTTKIVLKATFERRWTADERIGQIVFDPNGEYANDNAQDADGLVPSSIKNVWAEAPEGQREGFREDVITYGIVPHGNDPNRRLMLLNFHRDANLQVGKSIIDAMLDEHAAGAKYIRNFTNVVFEAPPEGDRGQQVRYRRRVLAYRTLLVKAGLDTPASLTPDTRGLFSQAMRDALDDDDQGEHTQRYKAAAVILGRSTVTWPQLFSALHTLELFIRDNGSKYGAFNRDYLAERDGREPWADEQLTSILGMFRYPNGPSAIAGVREQHTSGEQDDYVDDIYQLLVDGNLVIVDQSGGDVELNKMAADRILHRIFSGNQAVFRSGGIPPHILVYVEEAHNVLPSSSSTDTRDIWVRTAKEGAKLHIGLVYATQEVSSIQTNILKNTANWFIGHLNNTDETKELRKFYDFADFEDSILRAQDKGFIRLKTLSNPYVIPIQVDKFAVGVAEAADAV